MPKFFIQKNNIINSKIILENDDKRHIVNVLRKQIGDTLEVSDGEGTLYIVKITHIDKHQIISEILETRLEDINKINVTLYQSLPKSNKMDTIIQKCTELGIKKIVPFISNRTVVNIEDKLENKKVERWNKIAKEASKQSNRTIIPSVSSIYKLKDVLKEFETYDLGLLAYEKEEKRLKDVLQKNYNSKNIAIIIGPEGGFEEYEVEQIIRTGINSITLGDRILRTETAGMAVLCITMYELGYI